MTTWSPHLMLPLRTPTHTSPSFRYSQPSSLLPIHLTPSRGYQKFHFNYFTIAQILINNIFRLAPRLPGRLLPQIGTLILPILCPTSREKPRNLPHLKSQMICKFSPSPQPSRGSRRKNLSKGSAKGSELVFISEKVSLFGARAVNLMQGIYRFPRFRQSVFRGLGKFTQEYQIES